MVSFLRARETWGRWFSMSSNASTWTFFRSAKHETQKIVTAPQWGWICNTLDPVFGTGAWTLVVRGRVIGGACASHIYTATPSSSKLQRKEWFCQTNKLPLLLTRTYVLLLLRHQNYKSTHSSLASLKFFGALQKWGKKIPKEIFLFLATRAIFQVKEVKKYFYFLTKFLFFKSLLNIF